MQIKLLDENIINQIAAGEVIERPASVIKELIENSIDADADHIQITTAGHGVALIRVSDNGCGIPAEQLPLAIQRHCTSKMQQDIHDIHSLGFRGEALPSIGSVAKLKLISRCAEADHAYEIFVEGGKISAVRPASGNLGTSIEVRDLFYNTPVRLKFLKKSYAENNAIADVVKSLALAYPHISFFLSGSDRNNLEFAKTCSHPPQNFEKSAAQQSSFMTTQEEDAASATINLSAMPAWLRAKQILGEEFAENCTPIFLQQGGIKITGLAGLPAYNRANSLMQYCYVNQRFVRDKILFNAIRFAYQDLLARDRFPAIVLFIEISPEEIDVNVHPAKAEIRFKNSSFIRSCVICAIQKALKASGISPVSTHGHAMLQAFSSNAAAPPISTQAATNFSSFSYGASPVRRGHTGAASPIQAAYFAQLCEPMKQPLDLSENQDFLDKQLYPLGAPCGQIHKNYIIAQTVDSLVVVDQHAAHERIIYEKLKAALYEKPLESQLLLIPEIITLTAPLKQALLQHQDSLAKFGLNIEAFGAEAIMVRETPSFLGQFNVQALIKDLADEVYSDDKANSLERMLNYAAATMACHSSVRSGRQLKAEEMNHLLRQMEALPFSSTCNHGRPTYIELKLNDIERLFGRR